MCEKQILVDCGTDKNFCEECQQQIKIQDNRLQKNADRLVKRFFNIPQNYQPKYAPNIDHIDFPL